MGEDQATCKAPSAIVHRGQYVALEPLSPRHIDLLWNAAREADASWRYLRFGPFASRSAFGEQIEELISRKDQPFWAVCPAESDRAQGWLSYCDMSLRDRSIEIGQIWFSPVLQRTRASTEAVFLLMAHAFDELGFRRLVWRCVSDNEASSHAAQRYGFRPEGVWRAAVIVKGVEHDVAWHSLLSTEWEERRRLLETWLNPSNFDALGSELTQLRR